VHQDRTEYATMTTRTEAVRLGREHPDMTMTEIGRRLGVSRERVRQIFDKANIVRPVRRRRCLDCNNLATSSHALRCAFHQWARHHITVQCNYCGRWFSITRRVWNARIPERGYSEPKVFYCNRTCMGRWLGQHHGFGTRPHARKAQVGQRVRFQGRPQYQPHKGHVAEVLAREGPIYTVACECGQQLQPRAYNFEVVATDPLDKATTLL